MASRAERVALLCDISRELQRCGPIFLATLLVEEAYQRECLEGMAFGKAGQDAAVLRLNARLRRLVPPVRPEAAPALPPVKQRPRRRRPMIPVMAFEEMD